MSDEISAVRSRRATPFDRPFVRCLGLALGMLATGTGSARPQMEPTLDAAVTEFVQAETGGDALKKQSAQTLSRLVSSSPDRAKDPLVRVFSGAATARLAQTTFLPWRKINFAEDGLAEIDKALALLEPRNEIAAAGFTPVAKEVRYVAASVFVQLPSFFNRGPQSKALIKGLLDVVEREPLPPDFRASVYLLAGQEAADAGNKPQARAYFEKAIAFGVAPESQDAAKALAALK